MSRHSYDSRRYRRALREIQAAGPCCVICSHPGSDSIHHRLPASLFPDLAGDPANWVPAHGVEGCATCGMKCNQAQGNKLQPVKPPVTSRRW
jgi:5-methylcytosine-specific restriction endonuclease McrA